MKFLTRVFRSDPAEQLEADYYVGLSRYYREKVAGRVGGYEDNDSDYLRWAREYQENADRTYLSVLAELGEDAFIELVEEDACRFLLQGRGKLSRREVEAAMRGYSMFVFKLLDDLYQKSYEREVAGRMAGERANKLVEGVGHRMRGSYSGLP
jgi:hypothetical protein